jgi:hypothetical protein
MCTELLPGRLHFSIANAGRRFSLAPQSPLLYKFGEMAQTVGGAGQRFTVDTALRFGRSDLLGEPGTRIAPDRTLEVGFAQTESVRCDGGLCGH